MFAKSDNSNEINLQFCIAIVIVNKIVNSISKGSSSRVIIATRVSTIVVLCLMIASNNTSDSTGGVYSV